MSVVKVLKYTKNALECALKYNYRLHLTQSVEERVMSKKKNDPTGKLGYIAVMD